METLEGWSSALIRLVFLTVAVGRDHAMWFEKMFRLKGCRAGLDFSPLLSTCWCTHVCSSVCGHSHMHACVWWWACVVVGTLQGRRGVAPASGPRFCNSVLFQGHSSSFRKLLHVNLVLDEKFYNHLLFPFLYFYHAFRLVKEAMKLYRY